MPHDRANLFRLKPIKAALVSEISETTASAPVPEKDRVNFHIGNPLFDERLATAYLHTALGLKGQSDEHLTQNPDKLLDLAGWEPSEKLKLNFLIETIRKSSPYMPRGGYARKNPPPLIKAFHAWLNEQREPLIYDTGEQSGRREIILASGGVFEAIRIMLFVLSTSLEHTPARALTFGYEIPEAIKNLPNLMFDDLGVDELSACSQIEAYLRAQPELPVFLFISETLKEETRRRLRLLSIDHALFFVEVNNAPNHLSLAREAKLVRKVIRILTPAIFAPRLDSLSTVFIAGPAEYLNAIENVHFKLKGTPSASEVEFLTFVLTEKLAELNPNKPAGSNPSQLVYESSGFGIEAENTLPQIVERVESRLQRLVDSQSQKLETRLADFERNSETYRKRIQSASRSDLFDELSAVEPVELLEQLAGKFDDPEWRSALTRSYISSFCKHQPQYQPEACVVASGSSRTALGILGFHCGISEVIFPDLSWSYEQCFPVVHTVALHDTLALDVDAIIDKITELTSQDPSWHERGAVAINNPHNATGRIFNHEDVRRLVAYCLEHRITLIDDLSYQNVVPSDQYLEVKTARQIARELVYQGVLTADQADRVITVHSISKTDSMAGARLAIAEIRDPQLRQRFREVSDRIQPNLAAIVISYLFYRNSRQEVQTYWRLRNLLLLERSQALLTAAANLPAERNPYSLSIIPPLGSLYPLLQIERLPGGISLNWLSATLARQGIGLLPLSTFARTEDGFTTGRKTFRLTLGGSDDADTLQIKTRRLLIDLNRLIAEENARYNRKPITFRKISSRKNRALELVGIWDRIAEQIRLEADRNQILLQSISTPKLDKKFLRTEFQGEYLPERLATFRNRLLDRAAISDEQTALALSPNSNWLQARLEQEFFKDSLEVRQARFRLRTHDRTVHPTQSYSIHAEMALDEIVNAIILSREISTSQINRASEEILKEYLGLNISITSRDESDEILLDLNTMIAAEDYSELFATANLAPFLSFWSDWDGSNRPSGQGHQLAAAIVMKNVRQMSRIVHLLRAADPSVPVPADLIAQINRLPEQNRRFTQLLNNITHLTHQLEQRYRGILPFSVDATPAQQLLTRLNLRRDPVRILLQHNDRYERKMLELRQQRREMLEHYFSLNKALRKALNQSIPEIHKNRSFEPLLRESVGYRDLLQRTAITPRIHQGLITARDQFAIDTTVYNLDEINTISGKYGNPGMIMALQVSMSSKPEALISLDRKMQVQRENVLRKAPTVELPSIWLIPLFEDTESVENIPVYLDQIWEYANQSRQSAQSTHSRFAEIISEVFIAGSDLSQQVGQAASSHLYHKAKYQVQTWLAEHGTAEDVRFKLGSGESTQRQGGYYSPIAGQPAFSDSDDSRRRFARDLPPAARRSTAYATTPLQGIFLEGDLRTYQSNLSEQLRFLPAQDLVSLLHHVRESQHNHRDDLIRAAETITESRLSTHSRSLKELERLTVGTSESIYEDFLQELTDNFRLILYGREEDVVGIHVVSYFIGRSLPQLRDRPTSRRKAANGRDQGQQILSNIAEIVPFSEQGSLLRAIAHNQAQTAVLGLNQLTTGLFRALDRFAQKAFPEGERERMISEQLLPHLPVYDILRTLRTYQDWNGTIRKQIETAIPAGNSALAALREDSDTMMQILPLFQQELLRRHGLNVRDFLTNDHFISDLLPTIRPDLAVLLQKNLFNTDLDILLEDVTGKTSKVWSEEVARLLRVPKQIQFWRSIIWDEIGDTIYQRVQSFSELATALYSIPAPAAASGLPALTRSPKLSPALTGFLRTARADDEMRQFLVGTLEYLNSVAGANVEVPISIIRAMNDVERLAQIEESALPKIDQAMFRFCLLKIANLAGDNG